MGGGGEHAHARRQRACAAVGSVDPATTPAAHLIADIVDRSRRIERVLALSPPARCGPMNA